ncbi:unnamed protein product [Paramecium sonneborni]|uniref:Uncharacterized protein n=1 Tax=Paramecium sonneborni TaxID=65129 RepID=A0A8S1RT76_9CILI|nr:unnamed protein product [Paramecium sonneborni]
MKVLIKSLLEDLDVTSESEWQKEDKIKTCKKFLKYTIMTGQNRGKDSQYLVKKWTLMGM